MIFSKDKKPTEAGWWWCQVPKGHSRALQTPIPIRIVQRGTLLYVARGLFGTSVECSLGWALDRQWLWGDRIETPTIEAAMSGKGEGDAT